MTEVRTRGGQDRRGWRQRTLAPLSMIHATGRTVVVSWVRPRANGPIHVMVGGVLGSGGDDVPIAFPAGARGRRLDPDKRDQVLSALVWDPAQLALDTAGVVTESLADRLEDLFTLDGAPMGLVVVARPLTANEMQAAVDHLSDGIAALENRRSGRGIHRRRLERCESDLEYLDRSSASGCWALELWAGGTDQAAARSVAGMLAGSADLAEVPLVVRPGGSGIASQFDWGSTAMVGTDAVAAIARPPFSEIPGVRVTEIADFDQNVEDRIQLRLGSVLDVSRTPSAPFGVSLAAVNRHVLVTGATGSGKSESVRTILGALHRHGIPWLVIEPAKAEYAALAPWLDPANPLVVIRPGDANVAPPMLNPLEPSSAVVNGVRHHFPVQTHLDMVKALFTASFDAEDPFPQVLSAGLNRAYTSCGWNLVTGRASDPQLSPPQWPDLADLVRESLAVVDGLDYGNDVRGNVRGFIRVRVESLRTGTSGRFFEGGFPLDLDELLNRPVVFEIEDLGDDRDKAFFMGSLIIRLVELLRLREKFGLRQPGLSHVLVIEEAHRLLRRAPENSPSAQAVTMFANLLAEIRAYGEGVVVAEQIPSKVITDLVKNSAVKLMHRLPAEDDRSTVGATMNLSPTQSERVVSLEPGTAAAHTAGMDRPVLVHMDRIITRPITGAGLGRPKLASRSSACPPQCGGYACSLGELESARDLVSPQVALWAELAVIAALTWDRLGLARGEWLDRLRASDAHRARCAVGLAVAASVARRRGLIRRWHDPSILQAEMASLLASQLVTSASVDRSAKWAIGQFRLHEPARMLNADPADPAQRRTPHPATDSWRLRGINLPGPSWDDQLAQLEALRVATPAIRGVELAGSPAVLDDLARSLGCYQASESLRLTAAVGTLGLEPRWIADRVGASDDR